MSEDGIPAPLSPCRHKQLHSERGSLPERNLDEKCSEQASMAIPQYYCRLYTICCENELKHADCLDQVNTCEKIDAR